LSVQRKTPSRAAPAKLSRREPMRGSVVCRLFGHQRRCR
jgi:hypothetical protein